MINNCARRAKTATGAAYRRTVKSTLFACLLCLILHQFTPVIRQLNRQPLRAIWDSIFIERCKTLCFSLLCFPPSIFGKITSYLQRDNLQAPDVLLAVQHVLFTLANLPALYIAFFGVGRLLSYYFDPFGICINK